MADRIKISEVIVVEGVYDKIKVDSAVDATVIETDGFRIFKDKEKTALLRMLAKKRGLIILTDSDAAGFAIRNFVKQGIDRKNIKHAYIPDIFGKEKRKSAPSKEGKLGVEGVTNEIITDALIKAGAVNVAGQSQNECKIDRMALYNDGFIGSRDSAAMRRKLLLSLNLPVRMSTNMFLEIVNSLITYDEYKKIAESIENGVETQRGECYNSDMKQI